MYLFLLPFAAAIVFHLQARRKGCMLVKPTTFPLIAAFVVIVVASILVLAVKWMFARFGASEEISRMAGWVVELFFLAVYCLILARAWKSLKALPDVPPR